MKKYYIALIAIVISSGCMKQPEEPLRIGTNVWPGYEPLYLARHLGYFKDSPIKLVEYTSTSEVIRSFRSGAIEAAATTLDEALMMREHDPDCRVILVMDVSLGADVLLAKPGFKRLADLKDKRIGAENTALGAYMLARALEINGLSQNDIHVVSAEAGDHERVYQQGLVDAVVTFEPAKTRLMALGARKLFDSSQIPGEIVDVLVLHASYTGVGHNLRFSS